MSFAAETLVKPMSMATLTSIPSLFTTFSKVSSHCRQYSSIQFKPIKFQLSLSKTPSISHPFLVSVKRKEPFSRISVIAAQEEENNPIIFEDKEEVEEEEGLELQGNLSWGGASENEVGGEEIDVSVEPPEEAKVYVGNLPYDVDSEKLAQLFQQAGVVEIAEIIYNRETDQSRGFGFVTMSTVEEAERAVEMFHRYDVNGRLLTVNIAAPRGSRVERPPRTFELTYRIYVGNLPWSMDDERLEELFSEHGKVISARVVSDRETGRSRGFGFVVMSSESEMNDAIANLDGQSLDGRAIRVNVAEERPRR
ncbi:hypothetical protein BUALT_Bualt02G0134400 [Buddleja alternifolia]|uniref:RRM domain-containing protein n=1 Tax=Buddleja alternifolia TaxID=168488 RepID=A0AAV6YAL4_9LAMI|nr:hypothetical protein BUALT_Bualt02G0134400 [Buddleja alternifolia]